jgi:hypothetical protein
LQEVFLKHQVFATTTPDSPSINVFVRPRLAERVVIAKEIEQFNSKRGSQPTKSMLRRLQREWEDRKMILYDPDKKRRVRLEKRKNALAQV